MDKPRARNTAEKQREIQREPTRQAIGAAASWTGWSRSSRVAIQASAAPFSLAEHLIDKGIRVSAVVPGQVWTPLNPADKDAQSVKSFGRKTVMKRAAHPEELSPAYVFLAAPVCSSYITGAILPVTGEIG